MAVLIVTAFITHKIGVISIVLILIPTVFVRRVVTGESSLEKVTVLSILLLPIQWIYQTSFLSGLANAFAQKYLFEGSPGTTDEIVLSHATRPIPDFIDLLLRRGHGFVLLPIGAIAILYIIHNLKERDSTGKNQSAFIGASIGTVFLVFVTAIFPINIQIARIFPIFEITGAVAIGYLYSVRKQIRGSENIVKIILITIITIQLIAIPISPQYPSQPSLGIQENDAAALNWADTNHKGVVWTDRLAYSQVTNAQVNKVMNGNSYKYYKNGITDQLTERRLNCREMNTFVDREVDIYLKGGGGPYKLTYDLQATLSNTRNRIYDAGSSNIVKCIQ
jgi:hypothetical protein